ncbi:outer membrane receptor protein involved in Fe transport [Natronospira proteinivora]|uniref:Outer membrane receptor protein involved in Fe transport n=1 Tax=Natronospira proteinivora TaxID=1807133 RepID=A0ABT1G7N4_9GAMM|nr:TonB-dependent receptor [Natronospira proteinivora]MCP1727307.1 outer membrane receptor protein involved in Fe transport [Natronospira proteinivora]
MYSQLVRTILPVTLTATFIGTGGTATPIHAQDEEARDLGRVMVTGSRLTRLEMEEISPITVIDREQMENEGIQTTQDLFDRIPSLGAGSFTEAGDSNDDTGPDTSAAALRGLEANATLILINGRRTANSPFAKGITTSAVDLNTIPFSAIERIEVMRDGASAIYGTDAIAGVINIILRNNLQGGEIHASAGVSGDGDANEERVSLMWGSMEGSSRHITTLDWYNRDSVWMKDRQYSQSANKIGLHPDAIQTQPDGSSLPIDFRSSLGSNPGAYFLLDDEEWQPDPACPSDRLNESGEFCLFDFTPSMQLRPDSERTSLIHLTEYDISNTMQLYGEFWAHHRNSEIQGAATPSVDELFISEDHSGNPFNQDVRARYRFTDAGPRVQRQNHTSLRAVVGLTGLFSNPDWDYDVAAGYTRHAAQQHGIGGFININQAQDALDEDIYNPFGSEPNSSDAIDHIDTRTTRTGVSRQAFLDAGISGHLGKLPGGPIGLAGGVQYRDEFIRDTPDYQFRTGQLIGTEATQAEGGRDITSLYVETALPVNDMLDIQLALRHDDYSDFGTTTNPRIGLHFQPMQRLAFRASYSEGFRAPSIPEIGLGATEESPILVDTTRCGLTQDDQDCGPTEYIVQFEGNPNLDPETSESFNIGIIAEPLDWMSVTIDYWQIKHKNLIASDTQFILNNEDQFPDRVVRLEPTSDEQAQGIPGRIDFINDSFLNFGQQETDGIDLDVRMEWDQFGGRLRLDNSATYVLNFDRQLRDEGPVSELAGTFQRPQLRMMSRVNWDASTWGWTIGVRHVGSYTEENNSVGLPIDRRVNSWTVMDASVRWQATESMNVYARAHNLLDKEAPFVAGDISGYDLRNHDPRGRFMSVGASYAF